MSSSTPEFPSLRDGALRCEIDLRVYPLAAVRKAAYRLANECTAVIGTLDGNLLTVTLMFAPKIDENNAAATVRRFYQEMLDQTLRETIAAETASLRTLLIAAAFSRTGLLPES